MKKSRVIAWVTSVTVNLLILGFLTFWVMPVADIAKLPAIAAVHVAHLFAWV